MSKVFRQALIGARYGLLDQTSMDPRPDYFASFLWKRLMGPYVVSNILKQEENRRLRVYQHNDGISPISKRTLLAINISRKSRSTLAVEAAQQTRNTRQVLLSGEGSFDSRTLLVNGVRASDDLVFNWNKKTTRDKYHLQANPLHSRSHKLITIRIPPLSALFLRLE